MTEAHNTDCMAAMAQMEDNEFELAIVDPPYGIGDFQQSDANYKPVCWNNNIPTKEYFDEIIRISNNQIIWGGNYYNCFTKSGGAIIWDKLNPHPSMSDCEIASCSIGKRVVRYTYEWYGYIVKREDKNSFHPCQKPVALYKWLLKNYAKEGDRILDTHLGSGSSRIAAYDMGFDFVGYEIDKDYFDAQEKRFQNHIKQGSLFNPNEMY